MPRIVAGTVGGRSFDAPGGTTTRPTSDRVRESLFGRLHAWNAIEGARVLDLYCGSGALGMEAASRGARLVVMVDSSRVAATTARQNLHVLGLSTAEVVTSPVERYLALPTSTRFDLVLLDPPYALAEEDLRVALALLAGGGWLAEEAVVVVERSARGPEPTWPADLEGLDSRRYGETVLWFAAPVAQ